MRTAGIICEYNPFHKGHEYQLGLLRESGVECIICIMSGNFTQRGELAIADKYLRAEAALRAGADLVLELPFPYSSMSAEGFARAGIYILGSLGVDAVCFGHECEDAKKLFRAADIISSERFTAAMKEKKDKGSAASFFELYSELSGESEPLLSNDILGTAYICAQRELAPSMNIIPIRRKGLGYGQVGLSPEALPSALGIRRLLYSFSFEEAWQYMPDDAVEVYEEAEEKKFPISTEALENFILQFFRMMSPEEISERAIRLCGGGNGVAEDGCGLVARLCKLARTNTSFIDFIVAAYNSRFTDSRVRRVILYSLVGVSDAVCGTLPSYTTLLAANGVGCKYLSSIRKSSKLPIVTKPADALRTSLTFKLCDRADTLYVGAMPDMPDAGYFTERSPFILKNDG